MHTLKLIRHAIVRFVKRTWLLPQAVAIAVRQKRRQITLEQFEAERFDQIPDPTQYPGEPSIPKFAARWGDEPKCSRSADSQVCRVTGFQTCRLGSRRYGRFGSLRYRLHGR